jgi:hypothetical protein
MLIFDDQLKQTAGMKKLIFATWCRQITTQKKWLLCCVYEYKRSTSLFFLLPGQSSNIFLSLLQKFIVKDI